MSLGMQAIADELRNSMDQSAPDDGESVASAAPDDGDGSAEEQDAAAGTEAAADAEEEETSPDAESDEDEDEEESGRRTVGVDEALRILREHGGEEAANTLLEFQRGYTRLNQERSEIDRMRTQMREDREELEQLLQAAEERMGQQEEGEDEEGDDLSKIPPEQQELLQRWLKQNGYVSQEELSQQERDRAVREVVQSANQRGVEKWGDEFGHFNESGEFLVNPEVRDKMAPVFDRLVNQNGLTFEDLYVLVNYDQLVEQAKEAGRREGRNAANQRETQRQEKLNQSRTAGRSSSGASEPVIYDPENEQERGDIGAVFRKIRSHLSAAS